MNAATSYDPFNREAEREAEAVRDARLAHEWWSREQSLMGRSAMVRDNEPTMVLLKEEQ